MIKNTILSALFVLTLIPGLVHAQSDDSTFKKFRFGMKVAPNISWLKPEDRKNLLRDGTSLKLSYGLNIEYALNKTACISTGMEFNNNGARVVFATPADSNYYDPSDYIPTDKGRSYRYYLSNRNIKMNYLDIPVVLKMHTPEVNDFTYFLLFGFDLGFRMKSKSNDLGNLVTYKEGTDTIIKVDTGIEIPDVNVSKDLAVMRLGLNLGLGAEYKIASNTSVVVSLNFHKSFTNCFQISSDNIRSQGKSNLPFNQDARLNFFQLNLGILF